MNLDATERAMLAEPASPGQLSTAMRKMRDLELYSCAFQYTLTQPNGLPLVLAGTTISRTRAGALAHAFEVLARQLAAIHHQERRAAA